MCVGIHVSLTNTEIINKKTTLINDKRCFFFYYYLIYEKECRFMQKDFQRGQHTESLE